MQAADDAVWHGTTTLAALALPAPAAMASDIFTVAGTGVPGFAGDGGRATAAHLHYPGDVEPTADGGYLIADYSNRVVRRVSATGKIRTVAGTPGVGGYAGDGGQATAALLSGPTAVVETPDRGVLDSRLHQPLRSQGVPHRHHHDCGGHRGCGLARRWWPGHLRAPAQAGRRGGGL